MMINKLAKLMLVAVIGMLPVACGSNATDVPSLDAGNARPVEPTAVPALDDEARVMAFTEYLREQGIDVLDPVVDSEGNVQMPELAEGVEMTDEEWAEPFAACAHHIEGVTSGRERVDMSEILDEFVALATCLREKGYNVEDPTAETSTNGGKDFRVEFDWDDPETKAAYKECSSRD